MDDQSYRGGFADEIPVTPSPEVAPAGRGKRWPKIAAAVGITAGTAVGAAVLAAAASDPGTTAADSSTSTTAPGSQTTAPGSQTTQGGSGSSGSTTAPAGPGPRGRFGGMGPGPGMGGVLHGQFTVNAPNGGYETLEEASGTVASITNTSGSNWSITVTSADGNSTTFLIDSGTSVDGGETGVSSISKGDTVHVVGVLSNGTATAKQVMDQTVEQANGQSWRPGPPQQGTASGGSQA
jgi:hypothetical protein